MNKPDLTQDRELVELAEVMREAHLAKMAERGYPVQLYNSEYLAMADAARTHLGSGYTLPAANEANAERLARARYKAIGGCFERLSKFEKTTWVAVALEHMQAMHIMTDEKPAPTKTETEADAYCAGMKPWSLKKPEPAEKPVRDAVSRDEQREYEELVRELTIRMAGESPAEHVIDLAVEVADQYIDWRNGYRREVAKCKQ